MRAGKRIICGIMAGILMMMEPMSGYGMPGEEANSGPEITAPSAVLMEASTGTVICEKNADEPRNPASVTKIMTLILIFDALQSGKIHLTDEVVTSAQASCTGVSGTDSQPIFRQKAAACGGSWMWSWDLNDGMAGKM